MIHLRVDFTSDEKVDVDDEVVLELDAWGRWVRYHTSRLGTTGVAFRNFEAPNLDGGIALWWAMREHVETSGELKHRLYQLRRARHCVILSTVRVAS